MRAVLDTNTVISGLLWTGTPRQILKAAESRTLALCSTVFLLNELRRVLSRGKFSKKLNACGMTPESLSTRYAFLATVIDPAKIPPAVAADPSDDHVLARAVAARAEAIGSGDHHLLALHEFRGIPIITAAELLKQIQL